MKIKICVFDDSTQIRESLEMMLNSLDSIELTGFFSDGRDAVKKIKNCGASVVIMDIEMPHINGIEAVKEIRKELKDIHIIMFTVFEDDDNLFRSICAGAN